MSWRRLGKGQLHCCTSLQNIVVPNSVKAIKEHTFHHFTGLTTVTLVDGLWEIGYRAFNKCASLERIMIPHTFNEIHQTAFKRCSNLMTVVFGAEIEAIVSCEATRDWFMEGT